MNHLFTSGLVADLILALMLVEGCFLVLYHRRTGRGLTTAEVLSGLLAGGGLVLAVRGALVGAEWHWLAAALLLSLVAHAVDFYQRFRRRASESPRCAPDA